MFNAIERLGTSNNASGSEQHEIDLASLDCRALALEQWALVKTQVARRVQVERAKTVTAILDRLSFRRGQRAPASPYSNLTVSIPT
jgi:hypothetical protein